MSVKNASIEPVAIEAGRKYFTLDESNRALVYVSRVVDDITGVYHQILEMRRQLEAPDQLPDADEVDKAYDRAMDRLSELVDELHAVGVELKDFEKGLVDFPSLHNGREILLCWHKGEDGIVCWHEANEGYASRHPIDTLEQRAA